MKLIRRIQLTRDRSITVANLVDELLRRNGDSEVSFGDDGTFSLSQLQNEIQQMDAYLRTVIELRPWQPVAIYRSNNRRCFHWFLAIIRAGGVAVPLNPQLSLTEVRRILVESGTDVLITDTAVFERHILDISALPLRHCIQDDDAVSISGCQRITSVTEKFAPATIDPRATIAIFHTSGTSGHPKGAALSSRALLSARASIILVGFLLGPDDLAFIALPWSHIMAVSIALYGLMAGIRGCFMDRFEINAALDLIERYRITAFVGVPEIFTRLVNAAPESSRLRTIRLWLSASDHLPAEIRNRLREYGALFRFPAGRRIPPILLNGYGMVELGGLAMMGFELSFLPGSSDFCLPVPPYKIRIVDESGRVCRAGVTGECQILRPGFSPHYWRDSDGDKAILTNDGWLRTGDLARRNRLGLIQLVGRMKDVIKSGGYSVYVRELEETLLTHAAVARAVAFGLPHPQKGEVPVAVVEINSDAVEAELIEFCRANLAGYKCPRRIWVVPISSIPQNHTGKALRRVLREQYLSESVEKI